MARGGEGCSRWRCLQGAPPSRFDSACLASKGKPEGESVTYVFCINRNPCVRNGPGFFWSEREDLNLRGTSCGYGSWPAQRPPCERPHQLRGHTASWL